MIQIKEFISCLNERTIIAKIEEDDHFLLKNRFLTMINLATGQIDKTPIPDNLIICDNCENEINFPDEDAFLWVVFAESGAGQDRFAYCSKCCKLKYEEYKHE